MRVIAGSAKRLKLKTLDGMETRPTTDRIKETLFNMIAPYLYNCIFLDLFSGSGGIGIEALSRGAREAVFVEKNPKAVACIKENLTTTKFLDKSVILTEDALDALRELEGKKIFDYIFMDPPYGRDLERKALEYLNRSELIYEDTVIIIEASRETDFSYISELGYSLINIKEYKTNKHVFLERAGREDIC